MEQLIRGRDGFSRTMIGRVDAVAALREALEESCCSMAGDAPVVVLIEGEGGVGKTRLVREVLTGHEAPRGTVLVARADPAGVDRRYSMFGADADAETPSLVADGIRARFAGSAPHVLVLEDLHWVDGESAAVIERLAVEPWPDGVIVGTYRADDLSRRAPGGDLIARLERRADVRTIRLERLTRSEIGALVESVYGAAADSSAVAMLHQRTGGNPFFLEELLAVSGAASARDLARSPLPWSLTELVHAQLDGLTASQRRLAEIAAVGNSARFDVLAAVAALDEPSLIAELRVLIERRVLVEQADDEFAFRHALVRDAVASGLLGRERRRLHEQILGVLAALDVPESERAWHALGAGRFEEFVSLARSGSEAFMDAGSSFAALRLADAGLCEAPDDIELLWIALRSAWLLGFHDEADRYGARWRQLTAGDPVAYTRATRWSMRIQFELDNQPALREMMEELRRLIDLLGGSEPALLERTQALGWLAQMHMVLGNPHEAVQIADRAIEAAGAIGAEHVVRQARVERACALLELATPDAVAETLAVIDDTERSGDPVLTARAINNLIHRVRAYSPLGRSLLDRLRAAVDASGYDAMGDMWVVRRIDLALGDADLATARHLWNGLRHSSSSWARHREWRQIFEARLAYEEGRPVEVTDHATPDLQALQAAASILAADQRGDADGAWTEWQVLCAALEQCAVNCEPPVEAAWIAMRLNPGRADEIVAAFRCKPALAPYIPLVEAMRAASVEASVGSTVRLAGALDDEALVLPLYLTATLRTTLAEWSLASGDRQGAQRYLDQADSALAKWPGVRRDRVRALRRSLDRETAARPDSDLTAREQEVAALVAEGLSNGEIARRLYISPKTASVHVSNILMKLQMSNRAEIAAWAVRTGLAGTAAAG